MQTKQQATQAKPEAKTTVPNKVNDRITALSALYQGEKTDASAVFNAAMAMMGIAVAYLVGAIPFVDKITTGPIPWLFLLLLPMPLWLIAAFHSLMTLNAMSHGISVKIIEDALFEESGLRVKRDLVGSAAGDKIMDITQAKAAHIITTVVVYFGVFLLVIGFTAFALYSAMGIVDKDVVLVHAHVFEIAIVTYLLLAIIVVISWIVGLHMIKKGRDEIPSYNSYN
jgi:hypothetical protein